MDARVARMGRFDTERARPVPTGVARLTTRVVRRPPSFSGYNATVLLLTTLAFAGSTEWTPEAGVVQRGATTAAATVRPAAPATVDAQLLGAILKNQSPSPMVVNVWASWCGPCVAELPVFEALSKAGGANVILVNVDHPNAVLYADRVAASRAPTTRQLHLAPDDVAVAFAPWQGVIPVTLVIAPGGGVKARFVGGVDSDTLARALAAP